MGKVLSVTNAFFTTVIERMKYKLSEIDYRKVECPNCHKETEKRYVIEGKCRDCTIGA
ncbi:MAG: hypothetical protein ISR98_00140 [Parcubacteria group bacterium]|nr:hypothetical protein [Parcubacteria group bacterium]